MLKFIKNHYGSKQGLLNLVKFQILYLTGKYRRESKPDFSKINRFVFVCSGNICRSALADIVMKKIGGNATSFGLDTRGGDKADPRMVAFGGENGFDLSNHCTQKVQQYVPQDNDLLVGMEPVHIAILHTLFPKQQITALGLWLPIKKIYLHDPYSANSIYFNRCAEEIVAATKNLYKKHI